jgi:hypothetical protein
MAEGGSADDGRVLDARVLALFEEGDVVDTPTPGVRAWLARDPGDGSRRPVLIKRMSGAAGSKGRATAALVLLHPHVVRTRRWLADEEGKRLYVVRDAVHGKNLRQTLAPENTQRDAEAVRRLLLPILDALAYAHGAGVAHGGVSAENVLIGQDGMVLVSDWATADPKAPQHFRHYNGAASVEGDLRALRDLVTEFLPTTGAFARTAVRERIGGIVGRCDTLSDLRETVNALERLAAAPLPRGASVAAAPPAAAFDLGDADAEAAPDAGRPEMTCAPGEKLVRILQGGGGPASLVVRNVGDAPLVLRMIATQHPWLNVLPIDLPLAIAPGGRESIAFAISAARLTPGEYRSAVYLSANAGGAAAEDLRGGWFKHTVEIRISVEAAPAGPPASEDRPPLPAKTPSVPAGTGPGCLLALPAAVLTWIRGSFA